MQGTRLMDARLRRIRVLMKLADGVGKLGGMSGLRYQRDQFMGELVT